MNVNLQYVKVDTKIFLSVFVHFSKWFVIAIQFISIVLNAHAKIAFAEQ